MDETSVSPRRLQEKAEARYVAMQRCEMDIICASITSVSPRRLHEKAEAGHVAMQRREMKIICASEAGGGAIPSQAAQDGVGGAQTGAFGAAGRNLGG